MTNGLFLDRSGRFQRRNELEKGNHMRHPQDFDPLPPSHAQNLILFVGNFGVFLGHSLRMKSPFMPELELELSTVFA